MQPTRILIAGEIAQDKCTQALITAGFAVDGFHDGQAALRASHANEYSVALVDDGLLDPGALSLISDCQSRLPHLRSILLTSTPGTGSTLSALQQGLFDAIEPTMSLPIVVERVRRAAETSWLSAERHEMLRRLETLFETIPGLAFFATDDGNFTQINHAGAALLGFQANQLIGRSYRDLIPEAESAENIQWVFRERRTGERASIRRVVKLKTAEGEERLLEVTTTGSYITDVDGSRRFDATLGVGWDITEKSQLEEQLRHSQKMEAVGRLAGGVAHDFNNMLTVINGNAQLMRHQLGEDHPLLQELRDIEYAGEKAAELTKRLLSFSRRDLMMPKVVELSAVVEGVASMLTRLVGESVLLSYELDANEDRVLADKGQLEQVIMNLALNARDAMPHGGSLLVRTQEVEFNADNLPIELDLAPGPYVLLEVRDDGVGMHKETIEHIFEPFFTTKGPDEGTGLGLSVVYGIVKQHGGDILVRSTPGRGSVFYAYLPRTEVAAAPKRKEPTKFDRGGENVLIVEDEAMVRRLLRRSLEFQGYKVMEAKDGAEALFLLERQKVDLMITDMMMPGMTGAELARRARDARPKLSVLYMTGYIGGTVSQEDLLQNNARFLEKPVTAARLLDTVRELLDDPWSTPKTDPEGSPL